MPTKDAYTVFQQHYEGSMNVITPDIVKCGWVSATRLYELSEGTSLEPGKKMWGVTILDYDPETHTSTHNSDLSQPFHDKRKALGYIQYLKAEAKKGEA